MDGSALRSIRREMGLTQKELAWEIDVDKQTLSRWENEVHRLPRGVEFKLYEIADDSRLLDLIKSRRRLRTHGRPFQKKEFS